MERVQIIRPAKKIKVVGCANCPYKSNLPSSEDPSITESRCGHPSFIDVYPKVGEVEQFDPNNMFPDWCPLENDVEAVVITNPICGFNN